jgi:tRNA A-37 threonylcarbamoyl transferase component Bud32
MTPLSHDQYRTLRADAQVIEADGHGEKVLRLADGTFLKLFRRKRLVSSALLYPYAKRFADNIEALKSRGIACPSVIGVYRIAMLQRDLVHYAPLQGKTLRQIDDPTERLALRARFGAFVAELHNKGIYFRSLHLGNVVLGENGVLGLIDIAMSFMPNQLSRCSS